MEKPGKESRGWICPQEFADPAEISSFALRIVLLRVNEDRRQGMISSAGNYFPIPARAAIAAAADRVLTPSFCNT
jgi:hypothetical protein